MLGNPRAHNVAPIRDCLIERPHHHLQIAATPTSWINLVDALGLLRLDFIKADIEGHEASLVTGGRRVLARHRPALLLEMDGERLRRAGGSLPDLWSELASLGYGPNRLDGDGILIPWEGAPADGDVLWVHGAR